MEFRGLKAYKIDNRWYCELYGDYYSIHNGKVTRHTLFNGCLIIDMTSYELDYEEIFRNKRKVDKSLIMSKEYNDMCLFFKLLGDLPCNDYEHWLYDRELRVLAHDYFDMSMSHFVECYV